jgi:group I intron endonuclease
MMLGGVYVIRCLNNGRVYVGSSQNISGRWSQHRSLLKSGTHHSASLIEDWQRYGEASFQFEIVEIDPDRSKRLALEQSLLDSLRPFGENGYNKAPRSDSTRGAKRTPEQIAHIADCLRGKKLSEEHRAKISASGRGRKHGPETIEKMRQARLLNNHQRGRALTETQKSALHRKGEEHPWFGRGHSEETKTKLSILKSGAYAQLDHDGKEIAIWPRLSEAARALGLKRPDSIHRAARQGRLAAGYRWQRIS